MNVGDTMLYQLSVVGIRSLIELCTCLPLPSVSLFLVEYLFRNVLSICSQILCSVGVKPNDGDDELLDVAKNCGISQTR